MITIMTPLKRAADGKARVSGAVLARYLVQGVSCRFLFHAGPDRYLTAFETALKGEAKRVQIITEKRAALLEFIAAQRDQLGILPDCLHFADDNLILPRFPLLAEMEAILIHCLSIGAVASLYAPDHPACGCLMIRGDSLDVIRPLMASGCECSFITETLKARGYSIYAGFDSGVEHYGDFQSEQGRPVKFKPPIAPHVLELELDEIIRAVECHGNAFHFVYDPDHY